MRVAIVGPYSLSTAEFGGGNESATANLIEGLMTFGDIEVHVVTCTRGLRKRACVERNRVVYHLLPTLGRFQTLSMAILERYQIHRELRQIRPDVVHGMDFTMYGRACVESKYPAVVTIHGLLSEEYKYFDSMIDRLRAAVGSWLVERYCARHARYITQPTGHPGEYLGTLIKGKTYIIHNPVGRQFFEVDGLEEQGRLLFVGRIVPLKQLHHLVQALQIIKVRFPDTTLRVAGGASDSKYQQSVKEWARRLGVDADVQFLGSLSQEELLEEYRRCALLVLPSAQENSPMVIQEAMAVGKPVVATRVGGVPYLVDDGQTGFLVESGDIDELAEKILSILSNDGLRSKMGKLAKEKANLNFRSEVVAARMIEVYQEAIEDWRRETLQ